MGLCEQALSLYAAIGDLYSVGRGHLLVGDALAARGRAAEARGHYEAAATAWGERGLHALVAQHIQPRLARYEGKTGSTE